MGLFFIILLIFFSFLIIGRHSKTPERPPRRNEIEIEIIEEEVTYTPKRKRTTSRPRLSRLLYTSYDYSIGSPTGIGGFIDVETTGLDTEKDEVIEFSMVLFSFSRATGQIMEITDEYCGLRESSIPIDQWAAKVNSLSRNDICGKALDDARIEAMFEQAEFLVAHNANFDSRFVARLFPVSASKPWFCSMHGIDWKGEGFESKALQKLLRAHGIQVVKAHRAGDDTKAALSLLSKYGASGELYLRKLLRNGPINGKATFKKAVIGTGR